MILDYVPETEAYILRVPRSEAKEIMRAHGLDMSIGASTDKEAVLFTREPYAALSFHPYATDRARSVLGPLIREVEASEAKDSDGHYRLPPGEELWPFQRADLAYALARDNVLLGDEPGLGKTPQAIVYCNEVQPRRVLAIVPGGIRRQWERAVHRWSTLRSPKIHCIEKSNGGVWAGMDWTIISYELARNPDINFQLQCQGFDTVILDEAHYVKTRDSQRSKNILGPLTARAKHVIALTGTPMPNRPREMFNLAHHLCPDSIGFSSEAAFQAKYNPIEQIEVWDALSRRVVTRRSEDSGRHGELQMRLRANFMARHLKRVVRPDLKYPIYDLVQVEETAAVKQALAVERFLDIDIDLLTGRDVKALGQWATACHAIGVAIAPQATKYIATLLDGGESKLVVFAHHRDVMDTLEKGLHQYGLRRVDGATGPGAKDRAVQEFIQDPSIRVMLGNRLTLGTGTDGLQDVADHALIVEPSPVPGENIQCFDRLDRGGQRHQVQGEIFVAPGSLLEKILALALRKGDVIDRTLDRKV